MSQLTIFYDGGCPLCVSELRHLARLDKGDAIVLEDIHSETFAQRFPHIDPSAPTKYCMVSGKTVQ